MYYTPYSNNSPQYSRYRILSKCNEQNLYHFSCKQIWMFKQFYDEIKYNSKIITKFITIVMIKQITKAISPRGIAILKIKISDRQFHYPNPFIVYYDGQIQQKLIYAIKNKSYIKIGAQVKVTGLPHKAQIQIRCLTFSIVKDFNQITAHLQACIKSHLQSI